MTSHQWDVLNNILSFALCGAVVSALIVFWVMHRRRRAARGGRTLAGWWFYQYKQRRIEELRNQGYSDDEIAARNRELSEAASHALVALSVVGGIILMLMFTFVLPISLPVLAILWVRFIRQLFLLRNET